MQQQIKAILQALGEDTNREGLQDTPLRVEESLKFLTQGYSTKLEDIINNAIFQSDMDEMVVVKNIELYSLCEHHLLPFFGSVHVAYIPRGKVLGLSKIARVVEYFARRLQIQEQLTKQIAECILEVTDAAGVGVIIEAKHLCMMMRGVQKQESTMKTSMMLGEMRSNPASRAEFLSLVV